MKIPFSCNIIEPQFNNKYMHISAVDENELVKYLLSDANMTEISGDSIIWYIGTCNGKGVIEVGKYMINWNEGFSNWNNVVDMFMLFNEHGMSGENLAKIKVKYLEGFRSFTSMNSINDYLYSKQHGITWNHPDYNVTYDFKIRRPKEKMFLEFKSNLYKNDPDNVLNLIPVEDIKNIRLKPKTFSGNEDIKSNDIVITMNSGEEYSYSAPSYKKAEKLFIKLKKSLKIVKC